MSGSKHRLHNTETDNLISNLRGEVGDILLSWLVLRKLRRNVQYLYSGDIEKDNDNEGLKLLEILGDKLENDIVARLSELAEMEIGQLNFHFAQQKLLNRFDFKGDVESYQKFIKKNRFKDKRNQYISHKQLPEKWTEHKEIFISMPNIGKGVALAVKLMILIDKIFLGPSAIYLWREVLKKKEKPIVPLNVNFLLLPHMYLPTETRKIIIQKELEAGMEVWERVKTKINGQDVEVLLCKRWAAILFPSGVVMICPDYPLQELHEITFPTIKS